MKKLGVLGGVLLLGATVAFAGTIQVPFYLDNGDNLSMSTVFPTTGVATFICLKNPSTDDDVILTVRYFDNDGTERTPTANTYKILAGCAVSWRPVADDPTEDVGRNVPNKDGGNTNGTAVIEYDSALLMLGRVVALNGATGIKDSYGYTIFSQN